MILVTYTSHKECEINKQQCVLMCSLTLQHCVFMPVLSFRQYISYLPVSVQA